MSRSSEFSVHLLHKDLFFFFSSVTFFSVAFLPTVDDQFFSGVGSPAQRVCVVVAEFEEYNRLNRFNLDAYSEHVL